MLEAYDLKKIGPEKYNNIEVKYGETILEINAHKKKTF
jgi:hypothetical protein